MENLHHDTEIVVAYKPEELVQSFHIVATDADEYKKKIEYNTKKKKSSAHSTVRRRKMGMQMETSMKIGEQTLSIQDTDDNCWTVPSYRRRKIGVSQHKYPFLTTNIFQ